MKKRIISIMLIAAMLIAMTTTFAFARGREGKKIVIDESSYIGVEAAKEIALADAELEAEAVTFRKAKIDREDGIYVYEVEFCTETEKYEYEINAETGEIVTKETETKNAEKTAKPERTAKPKRTANPETTQAPEATAKPERTAKPTADTSAFIGEEAAQAAAIADAGLEADAVTVKRVKLDKEDGVYVYEVEFTTDTAKYEYEINAETGEIVNKEMKEKKIKANPKEDAAVDTSAFIGEEAAQAAAIADAGFEADAVAVEKIKLDKEDGVYVYEVEFRVDNTEYEYEINAETGEVVQKETETKRKGR